MNITEIELLPDGRICLFGATRKILQLLEELGLADDGVRQRLVQAHCHPGGEPSLKERENVVPARESAR